MPLKLDLIEDDRIRIRTSVTAQPAEPDVDAIVRGFRDLGAACPETHQPLHLRIRFERDSPGRENSRRIFLVLICEPRDLPVPTLSDVGSPAYATYPPTSSQSRP